MLEHEYLGTSSEHLPPLRPDDVTAEWLTGALQENHPGTVVSGVRRDAPVLGAGAKIRVELRYSANPDALPPVMIVKGGFGFHPPSHDFMYWTEMRAYRGVLPTLDVVRPAVFFAGTEPRHGHPVVIMADLAAQGVTFNNVLRPAGYEQMRGAVTAMAGYHARWWDDPALYDDRQLGFLDSHSSAAFFAYLDHVLEPGTWASYLALPRGTTLPRALADSARLAEAMRKLRDFQAASPFCVVHGDCHFGNSYRTAAGQVGWLDWNAKRAPWYKDFSYFVVSAVDPLDRRDWEQPLLREYLECLRRRGIDAPSFDEAWLAYRREIVHGLVIWTANGDDRGEFQLEPVNTGNTVRFAWAAVDHSVLSLFD